MQTWKALFLPFNCSHVCSTVEPPVSNHPKCKELVVTQSRQQVFNSRQIMNSRQLWNLYQRNKFMRTEASRDILKFRVLEMAFPGVLFFHHGIARMLFRQNSHKTGNMQCHQNISGIPQHCTV